MKLFFLIEFLNKSAGTERIATDVVNGIYEFTGWDITFVVLEKDINPYFALKDGIKVVSLESKLSKPMEAIRRLRTLILEQKPDYLLNVAVTMSRLSLLASAFTGTRVITWEHFNLYAGSKTGYLWRLISALTSYKTVVLTNRDRLSYPMIIRNKVMTIYNFPTNMGKSTSDLESDIAISVGRLDNQKGFDILLNVWKKVTEKNVKWKLQIVGSGDKEAILKEQARELGIEKYVEFIPATPEVAKYYRGASMYIMTSRFEGLPLVLIEAKQTGLPCISFDCPNGPDEVIRDGVDGKLIPMQDENKMASTILELMNDRNRIKAYGREAIIDVKKRFSKETIIEEWVKFLMK